MSATTPDFASTVTRSQRHQEGTYKLSFGGVLKSEFLKFRTLTSSWVLTITTIVLMMAFSVLVAFITVFSYRDRESDGAYPGGMTLENARDAAFHAPSGGISLAYLIFVSLAVVLIAGEFGTKSIISTLSAAPRRGQLFLAKTLVISLVAAIVAVISMVLGWVSAQLVLMTQDGLTFSLFEEKFLYNILGVVVVFVLTSWMGIGFGALIRNNAGAIVISVAVLFVLPIILALFSIGQWEWVSTLMNHIPQNLVSVLTNPDGTKSVEGASSGSTPGYVAAGFWYAVWCVVPLIAGFFSFVKRDPK